MDWVETKLSLKFMAGSEDSWRWRMVVAATTTTTLPRFIHLFSNSLMDKKSKRDFGFFCLLFICWLFVHIKIHVAVGYDRWKWKAHKEEARLNKFHVNTHHKHRNGKTNEIPKSRREKKIEFMKYWWIEREREKKFWLIDECKFTSRRAHSFLHPQLRRLPWTDSFALARLVCTLLTRQSFARCRVNPVQVNKCWCGEKKIRQSSIHIRLPHRINDDNWIICSINIVRSINSL